MIAVAAPHRYQGVQVLTWACVVRLQHYGLTRERLPNGMYERVGAQLSPLSSFWPTVAAPGPQWSFRRYSKESTLHFTHCKCQDVFVITFSTHVQPGCLGRSDWAHPCLYLVGRASKLESCRSTATRLHVIWGSGFSVATHRRAALLELQLAGHQRRDLPPSAARGPPPGGLQALPGTAEM